MVRRVQALGPRAVTICAALIGSLIVLAGCVSGQPRSSFTEDTFAIAAGHDAHEVGIGSGELASSRWTLLASVNGEGQLCLAVRWKPASEPNEEGCGFGAGVLDDEGRGYQPTATATSADGAVLVYGPAPEGSMIATLSTPTVAGTDCTIGTLKATTVPVDHVLPSWYPVAGKWFAAGIKIKDSECPIHVIFRDDHSRELVQRKNY